MTIEEQIKRKEAGIASYHKYLDDPNLCHVERKAAQIKVNVLYEDLLRLEKKR